MKLFDRNNIRLSWNLLLVVVFVAIAFPSLVSAGLLSGDPNAEQSGGISFSKNTLSGILEYAVYAPGNFNTSFDGADPSGGNDYVYAYQIIGGASTESIKELTVGLNGNESPASPGYVISPSNVSPNMPGGLNPCQLVGGGAPPKYTSCAWDFVVTKVKSGQSSKVLFFTSPYGPEMDSASIHGSLNASTMSVPSPVPEPGTLLLSLTAFGGIVAIVRARRRR
jgi:hypothetical protein